MKARFGVLAVVLAFAVQIFPASPALASHELVVTLIPATEASPIGSWAAYQVYVRDETGAPYSGELRWLTETGSAHILRGYVTVSEGWGRFGYTGTTVGEDTVLIMADVTNAPPAVATRVWYQADADAASTTPARVIFDDVYFDTPVDNQTHYHGFTVYNAAGERIRSGAWTAVVTGVHGPQTFSGSVDSNGYASFGYQASSPGWDELVVQFGNGWGVAAGSAARSYGLTTLDAPDATNLGLVPAFENDLPKVTATYDNGREAAEFGTCTITASDPSEFGNAIYGEGAQACSLNMHIQRITVQIQQYRWAGYWATKESYTSPWKSDTFIDKTIHWNCAAGTGVQTYRVVTTGEFVSRQGSSYRASVQSGDYLRVRCP